MIDVIAPTAEAACSTELDGQTVELGDGATVDAATRRRGR